jgi:gallate dioxygenase
MKTRLVRRRRWPQSFLSSPEETFEDAGSARAERNMVMPRDWRAMIHYGAIFFLLEKLGAVLGVSNLHIYAAMRGESLETFRQTRNAPCALYSVAGKDGGKLAWDADKEERKPS